MYNSSGKDIAVTLHWDKPAAEPPYFRVRQGTSSVIKRSYDEAMTEVKKLETNKGREAGTVKWRAAAEYVMNSAFCSHDHFSGRYAVEYRDNGDKSWKQFADISLDKTEKNDNLIRAYLSYLREWCRSREFMPNRHEPARFKEWRDNEAKEES